MALTDATVVLAKGDRTQWTEFSMLQWLRVECKSNLASGGKLEMKY